MSQHGEKIIEERSQFRGPFSEQAHVSQNLKMTFRSKPARWDALSKSEQEALDNMANKFARILTGDPHEIDSWADISGYAELILKEICK